MALVSYDYASGSEPEITDEEEEVNPVAVVVNKQRMNGESSNTASAPTNNLFSHLPEARPSTSNSASEETELEDFIPTVKTLKEKKKVQITIPALSDFDDLTEDEPAKKRVRPSDKGSGLLGLLPPVQTAPKASTMFVPHTVKKKAAQFVPAQVKRVINKPRVRRGSESDTDGEDIPVPDTFDDQMWEKVCGRAKVRKPAKIVQQEPEMVEEITIAPEPVEPYDGLDNTAFKELVGKTKRPLGNIKLIDINEEEIMPDKDLWMTKSLTDPELQPKAEPEETVDPTKKRKHHITYLAERAKATEQELKAAWATSKNNRMMSRAKYGF